VTEILGEFRPEAVVNCVGIIKQRAAAKDVLSSLEINSILPHRLSALCRVAGIRFIHFSTDCVFCGNAGPYTQDHPSDCTDLYGRTKYLGEVAGPGTMTIRSSIIGLELSAKASLIEWFLGQAGLIKGFKRAFYTGFTTREMSRIVERFLTDWRDIDGVWNIASEPINKFDLLKIFQKKLDKRDVEIGANEEFFCDRRLDGSLFTEKTGYRPPSWDSMLGELADEVREREMQ
jgi:dTDP-4-dehydrorhamnose reductase